MIGASAPASSANLGPGFDVMAVALDLRCRVWVEPADDWMLHEGGVVRLARDERVVRAAKSVRETPLAIHVVNEVPRARGLGSSAAVTAATAAAALRVETGSIDTRRVFDIVRRLEGHDDNAAAAVFGGLVASCDGAVTHLELHPNVTVVAAVPAAPLSTATARAALPEQVPMAAAARNLGRNTFLVEGLRRGDAALLRRARGDELHEPYRAALSPVTVAAIDAAIDAGAPHAAWSGAGPTAVAFTIEGPEPVMAAMQAALDRHGGGEAGVLAVDHAGVTVLDSEPPEIEGA